MSTSLIRIAIALSCAFAALALWVAGAGAEDTKVRTSVTINDECSFQCRSPGLSRNYTVTFFGKVRSDERECERRRTVSLLRKGDPGEGFERIGRTKSDAQGDWEMVRTDKPGFTDYIAKVKKVRKGPLRCLGATSDRESHDF